MTEVPWDNDFQSQVEYFLGVNVFFSPRHAMKLSIEGVIDLRFGTRCGNHGAY